MVTHRIPGMVTERAGNLGAGPRAGGPGGGDDMVRARELARTFGRGKRAVDAVQGLDFELVPGECLGLLGANGSGKSTTLLMVLGLLVPTRGDLAVLGGRAGRREARASTGYVPEEARRFGDLSGLETVRLFATLQGVPARERRRRSEQALDIVGLGRRDQRRRVGQYSRGMARRLALATAWVHRPRLLVLDEPTSGLDPLGVQDVLAILDTHRRDGGSALLSTHDRVTAEGACDRALVLDHGRTMREGTVASLLEGDDSASLLALFREDGHA